MLARAAVFVLAFLSFACLLGHFYGLWTMRLFGCWVLPPATALLAAIAYKSRGAARDFNSAYVWVVHGALGGVVAAIAYDLFRVPFVLNGAPLFKVFPRFGELLLGSNEPRWLVHTLGWGYHFSNGAALGIMFLALVSLCWRVNLFWTAVMWAAFVEAMLLLTPYAGFFGMRLDWSFVLMTGSAHLVFGVALGLYSWRLNGNMRKQACDTW